MGKYAADVDDHLVLPARVLLTLGRERELHQAGLPVPPAVPVQLILDTGSRRSSLIPSVLAGLTPLPGDDVLVETSTSTAATTLYWVRLEFPGTGLGPVGHLEVARLPLPSSLQEYHGVIGRDLLFRWERFLLEGRRRRLSIWDTRGPFDWMWW